MAYGLYCCSTQFDGLRQTFPHCHKTSVVCQILIEWIGFPGTRCFHGGTPWKYRVHKWCVIRNSLGTTVFRFGEKQFLGCQDFQCKRNSFGNNNIGGHKTMGICFKCYGQVDRNTSHIHQDNKELLRKYFAAITTRKRTTSLKHI